MCEFDGLLKWPLRIVALSPHPLHPVGDLWRGAERGVRVHRAIHTVLWNVTGKWQNKSWSSSWITTKLIGNIYNNMAFNWDFKATKDIHKATIFIFLVNYICYCCFILWYNRILQHSCPHLTLWARKTNLNHLFKLT